MGRAKTKTEFWYVLVFDTEFSRFVTRYELYPHKVAEWSKTGKPLEMSEEDAKYMALGLTLNGNFAVPVCNAYELDGQPFIEVDDGEEVNA